MLKISNLDEEKAEWNSNETHVIIPMVKEGSVDIKETETLFRSTIDVNTFEGDQATLMSGLEQGLVIGSDENLFETNASKNDLFITQNSDLKPFSSSSESKNSIAYPISYADEGRNEIIWEISLLKEKFKSNWLLGDKPIFEVKDGMVYCDASEDPSKNWQIDLEKGSNSSNYATNDLTLHVSKTNEGITLPVGGTISHAKISAKSINENSNFIANSENISSSFFPAENTKKLHTKKANNKIKIKNFFSNDVFSYKVKYEYQSKKFHKKNNSVNFLNSTKEHLPNIESQQLHKCKNRSTLIDKKATVLEWNEKNLMGTCNEKEILKNGQSILIVAESSVADNSLPLKKKSKMKKTVNLTTSECNNSRFLVRKERNKSKKLKVSSSIHMDNTLNEFLMNKFIKHKPLLKAQCSEESAIFKCNNSIIDKCKKSHNNNKLLDQKQTNCENLKSTNLFKYTPTDLRTDDYSNVFDLIENLKKCRLISASVWQILHSGLQEMDFDVFNEIKLKQNMKKGVNAASYSVQLKAFALILYFKQPAAFNHLARIYNTGWPSLAIIKDWKKKVNAHQGLKIQSQRVKI